MEERSLSCDPMVSVVVPVYNGERFLRQALDSALAQTYANIEVVIVNDGSTDGSASIIESYAGRPNVKSLWQPNRGVAAARNEAIRHASGEFIAFLDQDDLWLPEKLDVQVRYMREHPEVALVHCNQDHIDGNNQLIEFDWPTDIEGFCFKELFVRNRIAVLTVLIRRTCLEKIGLFDERLSGSDDYELWLRVAREFPIGRIDRVLALYRFHDSNVSLDRFRMTRTDFAAITSIVEKFPDVYRSIGKRTINARLAALNYQLGNWYMWKARNFKVARRHFYQALRLRPAHLPSYRRYLWCSLGDDARRSLAWYWHRIKSVSHFNARPMAATRERDGRQF